MKILFKLVVVLVVLGAGFVLTAGFWLKTALEQGGSKVLGTSLAVGGADVGFFSGALTLTNVAVGNPPGFQSPHLIAFERLHVVADVPATLQTGVVTLKEVTLEGPSAVFEGDLTTSNISRFNAGLTKASSASNTGASAAGQSQPTKVTIDAVKVAGGSVVLKLVPLGRTDITLPLPAFTLRDVGKQAGGITVANAVAEIFTPLTQGIASAATSEGGVLKQLGAGVKSVTESIKSLFK